jgi:hypothetical protein
MSYESLVFGCHYQGVGGTNKQIMMGGNRIINENCFFDAIRNAVIDPSISQTSPEPFMGSADYLQCVADACNAMGHINLNQPRGGVFLFLQCEIRNSTAEGILYSGGDQCRIQNVNVNGSGATAGIHLENPGFCILVNVGGATNTTLGLRVRRKATGQVAGTVDIGGTVNDLQVGGKAAQTWAGFGATNMSNDFASTTTSDASVLST